MEHSRAWLRGFCTVTHVVLPWVLSHMLPSCTQQSLLPYMPKGAWVWVQGGWGQGHVICILGWGLEIRVPMTI